MGLKFTILGCGNSFGVPYAGDDWGECDPSEPKNRRSRCSLLVQSEKAAVIIDTGADFRDQMNAHKVKSLDAVFYTHKHSDHIAGIDDLRVYSVRNGFPLPAYMDAETDKNIRETKLYLVKELNKEYPQVIEPEVVVPFEVIGVEDIIVETHDLYHGPLDCIGYRVGNLAYSLDMKDIRTPKTLEVLQGIDTWIVDGGGHMSESNPVHATFNRVMELNEKVKAKRVILTSLNKYVDYKTASAELPEGYEIAYDGMVIEV